MGNIAWVDALGSPIRGAFWHPAGKSAAKVEVLLVGPTDGPFFWRTFVQSVLIIVLCLAAASIAFIYEVFGRLGQSICRLALALLTGAVVLLLVLLAMTILRLKGLAVYTSAAVCSGLLLASWKTAKVRVALRLGKH